MYPLNFLVLLFLLVLLGIFIHFGVLVAAFDKLGLTSGQALVLMCMALLGSTINLPLCLVRVNQTEISKQRQVWSWPQLQRRYTGRTLIAVNVGGALLPLSFSLYLLLTREVALSSLLVAVVIVTWASYWLSRPIVNAP